ncbi:MAG: NADH:flavin oxidoreductase [Acidobacteria bacterium]|nr:MAG: NADH:flavin oxidoreductase [Acidobacteriota bacterium]
MSKPPIVRMGTLKGVERFLEHLRSLQLEIPCDRELLAGGRSPFCKPAERSGVKIGNSLAVQPMEGWDAGTDGNPSEHTLRRWQRFGRSGAKLIWGGEAVAVRHDGRASPNQLVIAPHTMNGLARLRAALIEEHCQVTGSTEGLLIGLQLTHSGRYSRPNQKNVNEPRILYRHPVLDRKLGLPDDYPVLTDGEICEIVADFHRAARAARELGFDFVDIKHCHGYLGHEFLSAHTREGRYGGSFENRTRFLTDVVQGIRSAAPGLHIGVRLSAFDTIPYRPDPADSTNGKLGPGIPEPHQDLVPYRWGFGVNPMNPLEGDLTEPARFLALLRDLGIRLVNLTAGSPYYNPHLQRPAFYPPSDGYQPPEDPLIQVALHLETTKKLKAQFPELLIVGSAYSYLQDFLPHVAQALLREGWLDLVALGRMTLSYPELIWDVIEGRPIEHKRICRTFSDCTTAPRNGLPSGCYPLDHYYKASELAAQLTAAKTGR